MEWMVPSGRVQVTIRSGCHGQGPAAFVGEVMMFRADGDEVRDVGAAFESPEDDVVDLALFEGDVAVVADTGSVHGSEFAALGAVDGAGGPAEVGDLAVAVQDVGDDVGVAAHSPHLGHRDGDAVVGLADAVLVQPVEQGGQVDDDADLGNPQIGR